MGVERQLKRINRPLNLLRRQIADAAPSLSRSELLDLADDIHDIIRRRHGETLLDLCIDAELSFKQWD